MSTRPDTRFAYTTLIRSIADQFEQPVEIIEDRFFDDAEPAPVDRVIEHRHAGLVGIGVEQAHFLGAGEEARGLRHRLAGLHRLGLRSEEHTSELQSLMRISYAVFCLKKKNKTTTLQHTQHIK